MFKGILCLILFLACGSLGMCKAMTFSQRLRELEELKEMMQILENEMQYRKDSLSIVFSRVGAYKKNRAMALLHCCSEQTAQHRTFTACWDAAIEKVYTSSGTALFADDLLILTDMGLQLGKTSIEGQTSMFSLINLKLDRQIMQATEEKKTKGKMYRSLGFAIGAVIVIILI